MIPGLQEAGFALLEAAAQKAAAPSVNAAALYRPSAFDRLNMPEGQKFTPELLSRWLREAHLGRTLHIVGFYQGEMRARDPHLDNELQDQTDMICSAELDALPFPAPPKSAAGRMSPESKLSHEVAAFLDARYDSPDYKLGEALAALAEGEWVGVGGYQIQVEPDLTPGTPEIVVDMTPLPSTRFWTETITTRLMFQPLGTWLPLVPVDDLGPNGSAQLVVHQPQAKIPSPSHRGVQRRCLNYWLIKQRGLIWWAQFVQDFGSPGLLGFFDPAVEGAQAVVERAFAEFGHGSKMAMPKGTEIKPLELAVRLGNETPHQQVADWCDRQISRVVSGHDQSSGVQRQAASKQSSDTGQDKAIRRAQSRADRIAATLREWDAKPAVAREFGPEVARKYTSVLSLRVDREKDLIGLSEAFKNFSDAGVETITVQSFHDATGFAMPEDADPFASAFAGKAAAPAAFGQPAVPKQLPPATDPAAQADQKAALARILPFAREAVRAAKAEGSIDPHAVLAALLEKAGKAADGSGDEIVKPYRDLIASAIDEGATVQQIVVRVLHRQTAQLDAPHLEDLLAATIAEAALQGVQLERRRKKAAK